MTRRGYQPNIAIPPGETIQEYLHARNMSQAELSKRIGLTQKTVNEIVKGKAPVTPQTALALEAVFATPARFWLSLEAGYQEDKARIERSHIDDSERDVVKRVPYSALANLGVVPKARSIESRAHNLRRFFGVASVNYVQTVLPCAFRREERDTASALALASWLRIGELAAQKQETARFDATRLRSLLPTLRSLSMDIATDSPPDRLQSLCASCGIALTFVPHLPKTYVNGATKWLGSDKVLIQLSLRRRYADIIWFNFFHELAHVLLHGRKETYISEGDEPDQSAKQDAGSDEQEANVWATAQLIPGRPYRLYLQRDKVNESSVRRFAQEIGVHPCIVVGRLQHDRILQFHEMNSLRPKLFWEAQADRGTP